MEDTEIIELYFRRNKAAIAETSAKYGTFCFSIAQNILSIDADAEECVNDTYGGKSVILTLRTCFNPMPSLEQVINGPEQIKFTEINGWELALFRYADDNWGECVYTEFVLDGVTCTISACGLENDELMQVLMSILPQKEYVTGPVSVAGTVTYVDSRTEDYFDGTKHHYSDNHDYITVDCGDTRLTVWLPGEANRFSVGDNVTITYSGEPATAYNIWPGQLIRVE